VANYVCVWKSHAEVHCNRLTTVRDIQDYASLMSLGLIAYSVTYSNLIRGKLGNGKVGNSKLGNGKLGNRKIGQR